jgi:transposase
MGEARVYVCTSPQDMRKSFDTLAVVATQYTQLPAQSGALFVFFGKCGTRVKVLWWDVNGFCLLAKRLHQAKFVTLKDKGVVVQVDSQALAELLRGVAHEKRTRKIKQKSTVPRLH